jgi:hypothetical protein
MRQALTTVTAVSCGVVLCGVVLCGVVLSGGALAQAPTAESIVNRHVQAIGGREAVAAIRTLVKKGTYVYNGLEFPVVVYQAREARAREEIAGLSRWGDKVREGATVVRAVDGYRAWAAGYEDAAEPTLLSPEATVEAVAVADFDGPLLDAAAKGNQVALVGRQELDGQAVWHLRVTLRSGAVEDYDLSVDDLMVKRREVAPPRPADFLAELQKPRVLHFDDYRVVAGVRLPFHVLIDEALFSREYDFESIEPNPPLAESLFVPPPDARPHRAGR